MDELEEIFKELFAYREGYVAIHTEPLKRAAQLSTNKKKYPELFEFLETLPKGIKFFVGIGPYYGFFGHELFKNNPKLMKNTYLIGVDKGKHTMTPYPSTMKKRYYIQKSLENLKNIRRNGKCIFQLENFKKDHVLWADKDFSNNCMIFGSGHGNEKYNLGNYKNIERLFTKEFLEEKIDFIFIRRMFQYVDWDDIIDKTCKFTNAYCIIDYSKRNLGTEKNLRSAVGEFVKWYEERYKGKLSEKKVAAYLKGYKERLEKIPYPEELNKLLKKKGFEIYKTKERETYFYTIARK